jgi:hypothetical protein
MNALPRSFHVMFRLTEESGGMLPQSPREELVGLTSDQARDLNLNVDQASVAAS